MYCHVSAILNWGLRKYAGAQGIEWPTVTYRMNEWTEPVTVPGCDPDCQHEWQEGPVTVTGNIGNAAKSTLTTNNGRGPQPGDKYYNNAKTITQGAYCRRCGGWRGDLGLEPDPVMYIGHLLLCLREWRRVLRDDGVCFVNLGDSYSAASTHAGKDKAGIHAHGEESAKALRGRSAGQFSDGLKAKDLCMIPAMFAMAARADGWWLRSDIIWAKPNPMPESVTDRPTSAHEHVFLLAKSARYFWDADSVREAAKPESYKRYEYAYGGTKAELLTDSGQRNDGYNEFRNPAGRNLRNVWHIATQPTPFAHFATFPEKLVEPCIRAGSSARGCCPECGVPWERVVERTDDIDASAKGSRFDRGKTAVNGNGRVQEGERFAKVATGWRPTCEHDAEPVPCTVLDPFHGSGTTGVVALREGRAYVGVDISREYLDGVTSERIAGGMQIGLPL